VTGSALRMRYRHSLIAVPVLYLAAACVLGVLIPELDASRDVEAAPGSGIGTARDILGATATGMIAFTGFVVAGLLVVVQFAAGQYSPRLVLWFRRDALIKHAIGCFLAAFAYALVALRQIEGEAAGFARHHGDRGPRAPPWLVRALPRSAPTRHGPPEAAHAVPSRRA
jgi:uncharacterized membrane protein